MDESWDSALIGVAWVNGKPTPAYSTEAMSRLAMARLGLTYDAAHEYIETFLHSDGVVIVDIGTPVEVRTVLAATSPTG